MSGSHSQPAGADAPPVPPLAPEIALVPPRAEFVYEAVFDLAPMRALGPSPRGERRIVPISGGRFAGPRLRGTVLAGGADRQLVRADGLRELDALYELETDDGAVLTVRNRVLIDPSPGARRTAFSTLTIAAPSGPHDWLNRGVFIGALIGLAPRPQVLIRVFQLA